MAAGGFKEFVAGETLDEDEINDFLMQGMLVFAGTAARGSAITSPVEGQFSFLKDSDTVQFYDGSAWVDYSGAPPLFDFLVVAGGGGGGGGENANPGDSGGGGGAGGYRNSITGELSGGSAVAERPLFVTAGTVTVTVGAGGAGGAIDNYGAPGNQSFFGSIVAVGGGAGAQRITPGFIGEGGRGGSGGGASGSFTSAGAGGGAITRQGFAGETTTDRNGRGGGGAGEAGGTDGAKQGGDGLSSSITGSAVTRAGGGGGGASSSALGVGGDGGGGDGGGINVDTAVAGTVNTGGGGGGGGLQAVGKAGGSGLVVVKYPDNVTLTIGAGLTSSTSSAGGFKTTTFTAGTDSVSF